LLPQLPDESLAAICTDPPYAIGITGAAWDGRDIKAMARRKHEQLSSGQAFQAWTSAWAAECLRLLKPGSYLCAFAAPRTVHRLVAGLEDAGFEIRDQLIWAYGTAVPKSRRISGDRGSALKPAYEPAVIARKPLEGTIEHNLTIHGTGALNIGAARIYDETYRDANGRLIGRWPANLAWSHHPACSSTRCDGDCPAPMLDQGQPSRLSRFFCSSKASTAEREAGCEQLPKHAAPVFSTKKGLPTPNRRNHHPTPKPIELMRFLTRLVCPIGGLVLDPFAGSGSGGIAAVLEGRQFIGIERESEYVDIARARIAHWVGQAAAKPRR
jgi:site-specific DNA-methyltransferase (adenine-specific)